MGTYLDIAVILVVALLVVSILLQVRGVGGGLFGAATTTYRTRRGVEKTLFQLTIALTAVFVVLAILNITLV
ncbi:MAG: preprotein translocase subunit SecG [SAR202 cluster bacterium]|nr:preprotein translocase subunit SecG [SAR202 cluster bacterium]